MSNDLSKYKFLMIFIKQFINNGMKNKSIVFFNVTSFFQLFFNILKIFSAIFFVPCAKSFTYNKFRLDFF